jgi:predicted enzyme related to lactoylglutathione lyase
MATEKINYIELPAKDIEGSKKFFTEAFGWGFVDYGPDYAAITDAGLDGGFYKSHLRAETATGSALVVLYSANLESAVRRVESAGGKVVKPVFSFPGGRRFHFTDPSGNEYAVWSE